MTPNELPPEILSSDVIKCSSEQKLCVSCKMETCDECRIHCSYHTVVAYQDPAKESIELAQITQDNIIHDGPNSYSVSSICHILSDSQSMFVKNEDLLNWTGRRRNVLGAIALDSQADDANDQTVTDTISHTTRNDDGNIYHQLGYIGRRRSPVAIRHVIEIDLGHEFFGDSQTLSKLRRSGGDAINLQPLIDLVESRQRFSCQCFTPYAIGKGVDVDGLPSRGCKVAKQCQCTLEFYLLNRWRCLPCYQVEAKRYDKKVFGLKMKQWQTQREQGIVRCTCGDRFNVQSFAAMCLWCEGEIAKR